MKQFQIVVIATVIALVIPVMIRKMKFLNKLTWIYAGAGFVLLAVVLNLPAFFKAAALDFSSASPAFVAVYSPFLFNYGKGFGSIAIGDFTNYFLGLAVTVSMVMGIIALVLLVRSSREGRGTAVPFTRYSRQDRTKDYRRPRAAAKRVSSARQVDIFECSNDFFSHHTEDDIF